MFRDYFRKAYRTLIPFIYSKSNYKMFLKSTLFELDDKIREIVFATDILSGIIKPIHIKAPFGKSALVVAPHQDDEIIGCGGSMLLHLKAGGKLHIVYVYDGGDEYREDGYHSRDSLVQIRENEANKVASKLGMKQPTFLRFETLKNNIDKAADDLKREIISSNADIIFAPFMLDYNFEHRMTNYALAEALSGLNIKPKIFGYEVWGLCIPNVIVNIDNVITIKQNLLSIYESQISGTDYVNCTIGLNMYHSRSFGAGECKYAERFFEIPGDEFVEIVTKLKNQKR